MAWSTLWKVWLRDYILQTFYWVNFTFVVYILKLVYFSRFVYDLVSSLKVDEAMPFSLFRLICWHWIPCLFYRLRSLLKCIFEVREKVIHHRVHRRRVWVYGEIRLFIVLEAPIILEIILEYLARLVFGRLFLFSCDVHITPVYAPPRGAALLSYMSCSWVRWLISSRPINHVFFDDRLHKFVGCKLSCCILLSAW